MNAKTACLISRALVLSAALSVTPRAHSEAVLQYFNTGWREITEKIPELAEAGYTALWLPPPTKASGGLSVGYDLWDPFDLGGKDQRGTIRTKYGTEAELLHMVEVAHRFGLRVYFDNIMNHRAFDIPGYNEETPVDLYPGMLPEDFHLKKTDDGFYRKWDNTRDWGSAWQVQNLGLADLVDIAHETPNANFGASEGSSHPKLSFVRDPTRPWQYDRTPDGKYVGFGVTNGITTEMILSNPGYYREDVGSYLIRAARWLMDRTKADGLRLDAVKHVPSYFFGKQSGGDKDSSTAGYTGGIQWQFNTTRGFSDWDNQRDSLFDHEIGRDDAFLFGEHLGTPPGYAEYMQAGMRLIDAPLHREMNERLGNPSSGLQGMDSPGWSGDASFSDSTGVAFAQSHDDDYSVRRELQHAYYLTRRGVANVYTDGYHKAGTLGESGGAFPRHANNPFLGQFGDPKLPHLLELGETFGRGWQVPRWSDSDVVAYERRDKRENPSMDDASGTVMLFMMNDNYASGQARPIQTSFPSAAGGANAYLHNYSTFNGGFYVWASDIAAGRVVIPPGGYFAFSWKNPDPSPLWGPGGGRPIEIRQGNSPAQKIRVTRRDGPDGDPEFNPYGLENRGFAPGTSPEPYAYQVELPRVTDASSLRFMVFSDGSTENVQIKLDGGMDINSQMGPAFGPQTGDKRDNPPAISSDTFLGYEQARFVQRQHPEKFAARLSDRNKIGSPGAETYRRLPSGEFTYADGPSASNSAMDTLGGTTSAFVYHDPLSTVSADAGSIPAAGASQFSTSPSGTVVWTKTGNVGEGYRAVMYYTLDGTNPEGAGGYGIGTTMAAPMSYRHMSDSGQGNWWSTEPIPGLTGGELRYKIAVFKCMDGQYPVASVWPSWQSEVDRKLRMMTVFEVSDLDGNSLQHYPHNDYGVRASGLPDGWHVVRARAYLKRWSQSSRQASIYRTFTQPFYLDTESPRGQILFPSKDGENLDGQGYEFAVRTDPTVSEVWYHISDGDPLNDDLSTGSWSGNGAGGEPFADSNRNGVRDAQETFEDINRNGIYDANLGDSWARATRVSSPSSDGTLPVEWRFPYQRIPSSGSASVRVRLVELSSSPRSGWTPSLSDDSGHFTTLSRSVLTRGPSTRVFVAWPQSDGDRVGPGYVAKVYFSKNLVTGMDEASVREAFTFRLQTSESGRREGGSPQPRSGYKIVWDETPDYHALAFDLPNMYNGNPDWLHAINVDFSRPGVLSAKSSRLVRSETVPPPPLVEIVSPQEIGSDGRQLEIALPARTPPQPGDRDVPVVVRTAGPASVVTLSMSLDYSPNSFGGTLSPRASTPESPNPRAEGDTLVHEFVLSPVTEGNYRIRAAVSASGSTNSAIRNAKVVFRQSVQVDGTGDSDDDGVPDMNETAQTPLPPRNDETWTNGEVHLWKLSSRSDPVLVDTDGSGLPDGLQLGVEWPISPASTDLAADTDGDGFPNFMPDLDPPVFNTPDRPGYEQRLPRTDQIGGSMTDPRLPDDDYDGLVDGREDLNRNGRVDIATTGDSGKASTIIRHPNIPTDRNSSRVKSAMLPSTARFLETDPNNPDTDGDGLPDGQEDSNGNGMVDIALLFADGTTRQLDYRSRTSADFKYNLASPSDSFARSDGLRRDGLPNVEISSRAVDYGALFADYNPAGTGLMQSSGWPKILITETDPLAYDTIGDGFRDGWKAKYGLDPLDNGVYNFRTAQPGNPDNLPTADISGDGLTNLDHYLAGTDPRSTSTPAPPGGSNKITIGPGPVVGSVDGTVYHEEFSDWRPADIVALDAYHGDGPNSQSGDIYPSYDRWDSSSDLVAFYARDGGDPSAGGDGKVYFRVDMDDLAPFAENGNLDIYVAMNHSPGVGERALPDEVDTMTDMRWRAVVAVYSPTAAKIFVDTDPNTNSNNLGDSPSQATGVVSHAQGTSSGVSEVYFNSELDSVEFSVPRQTLRASGWSGSDFGQLNFQVYTTRDGTGNNPPGPGDLPGRSDIRDTMEDDGLVENSYFAQVGREDVLKGWMSFAGRGSPPPSAKMVLVAEESQQMRNSAWIQDRIDDGAGSGYHRLLAAHSAFSVPLSLAVTPTLASAIQWASADPSRAQPWKDGPSFNSAVRSLASGGLLDLLSVPSAGHTMLYTPKEFDAENMELSRGWLGAIYGVPPSSRVIYLPERTVSAALLARIAELGFTATFVDQREHLEGWYGRTEALGPRGYKPNRVAGVDMLVVSEDLGAYRFSEQDGGASLQLRRALSRRARNQDREQAVIMMSSLEDFRNYGNASGYDKNLRWMSNKQWVSFTTATSLASSGWSPVSRPLPQGVRSKGYVQYSTGGSYDHWYYGSPTRESLSGKKFDIRPGTPMPLEFGQMGVGGVAENTWSSVRTIAPSSHLGWLARAAMGSGMFATAFHNQGSVDLRKFSNGEYINPPSGFEYLSDFSSSSQASLRHASVYAEVAAWLSLSSSATMRLSYARDVDGDGEPEYVLCNNRILAVFEAMGGRMTAAWLRDPSSGKVWQVAGNPLAAPAFADEREGGDVSTARRTSGFKDWYAVPLSGSGHSKADEMYSVSSIANGFRFAAPGVTKDITVAKGDDPRLEARYSLSGLDRLFVRMGLSPNLADLLVNGQKNLGWERYPSAARLELVNTSAPDTVRAFVEVSSPSSINAAAADEPQQVLSAQPTITRRSQPQTHQVEVELPGSSSTHLVTMGFDNGVDYAPPDPFGDFLALHFPPSATEAQKAPEADPDGDGFSNYAEFLLGLVPTRPDGANPLGVSSLYRPEGFDVSFETVPQRTYMVESSETLQQGSWSPVPNGTRTGTGYRQTVTDQVAGASRKFYRVRVFLPAE